MKDEVSQVSALSGNLKTILQADGPKYESIPLLYSEKFGEIQLAAGEFRSQKFCMPPIAADKIFVEIPIYPEELSVEDGLLELTGSLLKDEISMAAGISGGHKVIPVVYPSEFGKSDRTNLKKHFINIILKEGE